MDENTRPRTAYPVKYSAMELGCKAVELQTGEISVKISVDDLRLIIRDNIRPWNWGVSPGNYTVIML